LSYNEVKEIVFSCAINQNYFFSEYKKVGRMLWKSMINKKIETLKSNIILLLIFILFFTILYFLINNCSLFFIYFHIIAYLILSETSTINHWIFNFPIINQQYLQLFVTSISHIKLRRTDLFFFSPKWMLARMLRVAW